MKRKRSSTRRSFLRAVGVGATALPFYRLLEDSVAKAAGETLPLRFAGIYHPHGIAAELYVMQSGDTETNFSLTYTGSNGAVCSLQPFDDAATYGKSFKNKIIAIEGIDLMSNANGHSTAGTILTGSYIDGTKPKNSSIDQFLAVERKLGASTRVTSIALGVGNDSTDCGWTLSYGPGGAPLPKIIDPQKAWDTLFAGYTATDDPNAAAADARRRMLGKSIVDFVVGDVNRLNSRLASAEKQKLQQHLDAMNDMSKQFDAVTSTGGTGGSSCSAGTRPTNPASIRQYNGGEQYFDTITNMFIDMLAQAFACDITRFATLFMNDLSYANNPLMLPADNHGSVAHTYNGSPVGNDGHPGSGDPATWALLAKFNRYSYGKIARFMQKLDGLGALDNAIIYASSDMGNPAQHSTRNAPTLLAGGANGKFRMGRRLKAAADCPSSNVWCAPGDSSFTATTNNKILVAIAQAFGLSDVNSFGTQNNSAWTTGALPNLT